MKEGDIELILCTTAFTLFRRTRGTDIRNGPGRARKKNGMDLRCGPAKLHVEPVPGSSGRHYFFFLLIVVVDLVLGSRGRCTRAPRPVPGRGVPLAAVLAGPALDLWGGKRSHVVSTNWRRTFGFLTTHIYHLCPRIYAGYRYSAT